MTSRPEDDRLLPEEGVPPEGIEPVADDRWHRLLGVLVLLASFAAGAIGYAYNVFLDTPLPLPQEGLVLQVEPGSSLAHLAQRLADQGLMRYPRWWRWHARLTGLAGRIKAGEFRVPAGTTPRSLLELLVRGEAVQYDYRIIEGHTAAQLFAALRADPRLVHGMPPDGAGVMAALGRAGLHPEGRFLPDTYFYTRGDSDLDILRRALEAMDQELAQAWSERDPGLPLASPDEALILASIVEKETGLAAERPRIAGVFVKRLRLGMLLQTDPTVIYGLGEAFDGNLRRSDLRKDTPYNTYTRHGLPPTPIALPGRAAIAAAVHPQVGGALYFVGKGDGSHAFSDTLAEHNAKVARYQLKRQ